MNGMQEEGRGLDLTGSGMEKMATTYQEGNEFSGSKML
jgi:hypothetical protein